jgi:hypothetical protein
LTITLTDNGKGYDVIVDNEVVGIIDTATADALDSFL